MNVIGKTPVFWVLVLIAKEGVSFTPYRTFVRIPHYAKHVRCKENNALSQKPSSRLFIGTNEQDKKTGTGAHAKDDTAGSDKNVSMFFASPNTDNSKDDRLTRARGIPYQFYVMIHDERSCTVTAQQFACQMIEAAGIDSTIKFDVSIPYDATAQYYYEESDKSINFDQFNTQYLSDAIDLVKRKKIGANELVGDFQVDDSAKIITTLLNDDGRQETKESQAFHLPFAKDISDIITLPQSELTDAGLVLLSSFLVAVGTLPTGTFPDFISKMSFDIEEGLSIFFCFGFFLRWYSVGNLSPKYFMKFLPFIDFIASVLPFALTTSIFSLGATSVPSWLIANSALVNLRLLRLLRLQEFLTDIETFKKVAEVLGVESEGLRPYQLKLGRVVITIFSLLSVSTGLIYTAEHEVNDSIPDYFTALYFGLTTLTTVGFGDIVPVTLPGKLVVMGSILVGVAIIPAQGAELVEALLDYNSERRQKKLIKTTLRTRTLGGGYENDAMIDPRISCASCGKRNHRGDAFFCWSCGSKLWQ
jgi:voltage-gated potassium channel